VIGTLRATCTGAGTRAVSPGSIFPVGQTPLTCSAVDAFGHVVQQAFKRQRP